MPLKDDTAKSGSKAGTSEKKTRRAIVPTATVLRIYNQCGIDGEDYNTFLRKLMTVGKYKTRAQAQERVRRAENLLHSKYGFELQRLPGSKRLPKTGDELLLAFGSAVKMRT